MGGSNLPFRANQCGGRFSEGGWFVSETVMMCVCLCVCVCVCMSVCVCLSSPPFGSSPERKNTVFIWCFRYHPEGTAQMVCSSAAGVCCLFLFLARSFFSSFSLSLLFLSPSLSVSPYLSFSVSLFALHHSLSYIPMLAARTGPVTHSSVRNQSLLLSLAN